MLTHYPSSAITTPLDGILDATALQFPLQASKLISDVCDEQGIEKRSLFEIGCSVGGCTFRFAERFEHVVAIDLEAQTVAAARDMQDNGSVTVQIKVRGGFSTVSVTVNAPGK